MSAGKYRHRVELLREEGAAGPYSSSTWTPVKKLWVKKERPQGEEFYAAAAVNQERSVILTTRYQKGITQKQRVRVDGEDYDIKSAEDEDGLKKEIIIRAVIVRE